jgi:F-type H+-transporting ATPase subunit gamma
MATLRDIKKRIRAVVNTKQITKAMEMVAAARLRRAQMLVEQSRPYSEKMRLILEQISSASANFEHPFFEKREVKKKAYVVFTSDRGLCGSYNANVVRRTVQELNAEPELDQRLVLVGKKGHDFFKRRDWEIAEVYKDMKGKMDYGVAQDLTDRLIEMFMSHEVDRVDLIYTQFLGTANFQLGVSRFLPIEPPEVEETAGRDYIFEPDPQHIFDSLMPAYARTIVQMALADALASEHGTRMIAMNAATKNAEEMIDSLTLTYNKARQAAITTELLEIVGGAEALEG